MDALEFIDIISPKHSRTTCSDDNISNGFYTQDGKSFRSRCLRCMYIEIINGEKIPDDFNVDL
jgi:hypothetical protein